MTEKVDAFVNGRKLEAEVIEVEDQAGTEKKNAVIFRGGSIYQPNQTTQRSIPNSSSYVDPRPNWKQLVFGVGLGAAAYLILRGSQKSRR